MSPIAIDAELVAKLTANGGQVSLTDPAGKPVGYFVAPEVFESMRKAVLELAKGQVSLEEFRRALADPRRHTTDEVFNLLERA